jgi:hypothetical protein
MLSKDLSVIFKIKICLACLHDKPFSFSPTPNSTSLNSTHPHTTHLQNIQQTKNALTLNEEVLIQNAANNGSPDAINGAHNEPLIAEAIPHMLGPPPQKGDQSGDALASEQLLPVQVVLGQTRQNEEQVRLDLDVQLVARALPVAHRWVIAI